MNKKLALFGGIGIGLAAGIAYFLSHKRRERVKSLVKEASLNTAEKVYEAIPDSVKLATDKWLLCFFSLSETCSPMLRDFFS